MKKNIRILNLIITYKVIHNAHEQIKSRSPGIGEKVNTQCRLVYNSNNVLPGATALFNATLCEYNIINRYSHKNALEFNSAAYTAALYVKSYLRIKLVKSLFCFFIIYRVEFKSHIFKAQLLARN